MLLIIAKRFARADNCGKFQAGQIRNVSVTNRTRSIAMCLHSSRGSPLYAVERCTRVVVKIYDTACESASFASLEDSLSDSRSL